MKRNNFGLPKDKFRINIKRIGGFTNCPFEIPDFQTDVDGNFQSLQDPSYQDYRAEAQTHFELRTESIKKAALAYSKKQGELAKIYADQVRGQATVC